LARRLSEILLSLHNCGWLHKGILPENIIFLPAPKVDFKEPFLVGWNYSREDKGGHLTETVATASPDDLLYRHPDHVNRLYYKQEYDHYQLGCLLIEIAYWETLPELRDKMPNKPEPGSQEWMEVLVEQAGRIKRDMGEIYSDVVLSLLRGLDFDGHVGDFWEDVVFALYQCNA
jgi:hypothetical protein